jgi:hypothetical protein
MSKRDHLILWGFVITFALLLDIAWKVRNL